MSNLSKTETSINGYVVRRDLGDTEPRIHDLDLGKRLGYAHPISVRKLIRQLRDDGKLPGVSQISVSAIRADGLPSKPSLEFWLTEKQALKVIAKSGTDVADAILDEVIAVFIAARNGTRATATHLLLADTASEWQPMWKRELQDEFCEIYGKPKTKRPPRFLAGVQSLIYKRIAGGDTYAEMKRRIPEPKHGANLHQLFNDKARGGFEGQLAVVLGILKTSHSPADFWARFNFLYADRPMQLTFGARA